MRGTTQQQSAESGSMRFKERRHQYPRFICDRSSRALLTLLQNNFHQLREEARRTAEEQVRAFGENLANRLAKDAASIAWEKFREPDVQAAINDAVQASARRGKAANPDILSTLISERIAKQSNDYKEIVLSEALRVDTSAYRGTDFSSVICALHSVDGDRGLPAVAALENVGQITLHFSSEGFGLSESQKQHLQYAGAASVNNVLGGDIFDMQSQEYKYFGIVGGVAFKEALTISAPSYLRLLEQFTKDNLFPIGLTSVGQAIALANISKYVQPLDYTIWLK